MTAPTPERTPRHDQLRAAVTACLPELPDVQANTLVQAVLAAGWSPLSQAVDAKASEDRRVTADRSAARAAVQGWVEFDRSNRPGRPDTEPVHCSYQSHPMTRADLAALVDENEALTRTLAGFYAECDAVGIPYDAPGLVRHWKGNAGLTAAFDAMNDWWPERQQLIDDLAEARTALAEAAGTPEKSS